MTEAVPKRLNESARAALAAHFLALPPQDRRLRFGSSLSSAAVAAYVRGIDFDRDAVFGVHDDALRLIGVAHLAFGQDFAELGVSVLPRHRGCGAGGALFARAAEHARNRFVSRIVMHCLSDNAPIMRIARRTGMAIVVASGDVDAHLVLPPATSLSVLGEVVGEGFAFCDYALRAQLAAWKGLNAAIEGATLAQRRRPEARVPDRP